MPSELFDELNNSNIIYWLDSGSLLGIVRDNELLSQDPDIDIGIQECSVRDIIEIIEILNYNESSRKIFTYDCRPHKIKVEFEEIGRTIDINIFNKLGGKLWSPAITRKLTYDYTKQNPLFYFYYVLLSMDNKAKSKTWERNSFVPNLCLPEARTWVYPMDLIGSPIMMDNRNIKIPEKYKKYLTYRYGNWNEPDKDWDFWEDDGGLIKKSPTKIGKEF